MKIRKMGILAVTFVCALLLNGCGTQMYELTQKEEEVIVNYAAYAVAKHNIYQKDGAQIINSSLLEPDTEDEVKPEKEDKEDTQTPSSGSGGSSQSGGSNVQGDEILLAEAIGQSGTLDVAYKGYEVCDNYREGDYYSIDAAKGYTYVVMNFSLKNVTSATVEVDILSLEPTFRACFKGDKWVSEEVTLLLYNLSTYEGKLASQQAVDVVLIFQISDSLAGEISDIKLSVEQDGKIRPIKL